MLELSLESDGCPAKQIKHLDPVRCTWHDPSSDDSDKLVDDSIVDD